jgi:hypothetical protein
MDPVISSMLDIEMDPTNFHYEDAYGVPKFVSFSEQEQDPGFSMGRIPIPNLLYSSLVTQCEISLTIRL